MNNKAVKIILDVVMTLLMIVLMDLSATGFFWHELLGLLLFGLFAIHKVLNRQWIKAVTNAIFSGKRAPRARFMYLLDMSLLLFMSITIISGIIISESLFTFINLNNEPLWDTLHTSFSYGSLVLISIHIGMHWKYIMVAFRKMLSIRSESKTRTVIFRSMAAILVFMGIKNSFNINLGDKLLSPLTYSKLEYGAVLQNSQQTTELYDTGKLSTNINLIASNQSSIDEGTTLEDYLGNLFCTACHKHCSLLSPRCSKGVRQAKQAAIEYNASIQQSQNNDAAENDSQDNTQHEVKSSLLDPFTGFTPIMTLFVAGTYYTVSFIDKKKKE